MSLVPDLPAEARCPRCGQTLDEFGDHLMCCQSNNFAARHGALQGVLIEILAQARQPCEREVGLDTDNAGRTLRQQLRPADILLKGWDGGKDVAVDVTVVHPVQQSERPWNSTRAKSFLRKREEAKTKKYEEPCRKEGWGFLPMAFSTWCTPGPGADRLLGRIIRRAAAAADPSQKATRIAQLSNQVSLAIFRQVLSFLTPIHLPSQW